jgi:hypothetical protein
VCYIQRHGRVLVAALATRDATIERGEHRRALSAGVDADIAALVAEVERLREGIENERDAQRKRADSLALAYREQQGENDVLRAKLEAAQRERHRRIADEAIERIESAEDERAAVVAWLRADAAERDMEGDCYIPGYAAVALRRGANAIERGEHRRKEKE